VSTLNLKIIIIITSANRSCTKTIYLDNKQIY